MVKNKVRSITIDYMTLLADILEIIIQMRLAFSVFC